jgi:hypothetical protein
MRHENLRFLHFENALEGRFYAALDHASISFPAGTCMGGDVHHIKDLPALRCCIRCDNAAQHI